MSRTPLVLALLAVGCGPLEENQLQTGSTTIVGSQSRASVHVVNPGVGTVSTANLSDGSFAEVEVGVEPTRLARLDNQVFVTLRGERGVVALSEDEAGNLSEAWRTDVGREPYGVAVDHEGGRVFVALSQESAVVELDPSSGDEIARWPVAGEPRYVAAHKNGESVFVATPQGTLHRIDLEADTVEEWELPPVPLSTDGVRTPRIPGDISVSPSGDWLAIPVRYVNLTNPLDERPTQQYYGGSDPTGGKLHLSSVATIALQPDGSHAGFTQVSVLDSTYPTSATFSPNGQQIWVSNEANNTVEVVSKDQSVPTDQPSAALDMHGTWEGVSSATIQTDAGPRGVTFVGRNDVQVHNFLDRTTTRMPSYTTSSVAVAPVAASDSTPVSAMTLPDGVEQGRRLFYSATDSRMSNSDTNVSCSTCHFDGRTDGLTLQFSDMDKQIPSLAGKVSDTAPFTWTDTVDTVAEEAQITSGTRMGGIGLADFEAGFVEAFVDSTPNVDHAGRGVASEDVMLGEQVFMRAEVGCFNCHKPETAFTDGNTYEIFDGHLTRTPTLRGIAASAPYFHDGSAPTLRTVVEFAADGNMKMGDTSMLSNDEKDALVAYLMSL